jgi:hypothetical protein
MLSADEQEHIIRANRQAFEQMALSWRNPETGETEPDLRQAARKMICDYLAVPGYCCVGDRLYELIESLQEAALDEDSRPEIQLTEEKISDAVRAALKRLGPDDNIPDGTTLCWDWDDGEWDWELSIRDTQANIDCGYVAIVPLKNGRRFEFRIKPPPSHNAWALRFVVTSSTINVAIPDIIIKGSLHEAKRRLDMLLGIDTPAL